MAKEFLAKIDLSKMSAAPTVDEVREKMGLAPKQSESAVSNDFDDAAPVASTEETSDDDDFDFDK